MIDTLKLARRLELAQMPKEQAEALADGLNESLAESYVTREYLDSKLITLKEELTFRMVIVTVAVVGLANGTLFWMLSNLIHSLK